MANHTNNLKMIYDLIVDGLDKVGINVAGYGPPSEVLTKLTASNDESFAVIEFPQSSYDTNKLLPIVFDVETTWTIWIYNGTESQNISNQSGFTTMVTNHSTSQSLFLAALDKMMCHQENNAQNEVVFSMMGSTSGTFYEEHSNKRLLGGRFTLATKYFQRCSNLTNCD